MQGSQIFGRKYRARRGERHLSVFFPWLAQLGNRESERKKSAGLGNQEGRDDTENFVLGVRKTSTNPFRFPSNAGVWCSSYGRYCITKQDRKRTNIGLKFGILELEENDLCVQLIWTEYIPIRARQLEEARFEERKDCS